MERRSTVQENIATLNNLVESVPNYGLLSVNHTRSGARVGSIFVGKQPRNHERFEELESHEFWQTTFIKLEFRTDDDHGTTRVVDTFTKKVLTEATLLTFEKVREGFELTTTILGAGLTAMIGIIIYQSINGFLEHTHFVVNNHFWRIEVE